MTDAADSRTDTVVDVDHLGKWYSGEPAVDGVSFQVQRGEVFGLLGPNGAGKTTTVEVLQGLRSRDAGSVRVLGLDPAAAPARLRQRIGSQLQSSALPARLRVGEALSLFGSVRGCSRRRVQEALEEWRLSDLRRQPYAALSGGQRQRLFLAIALLGDPEILFLDELTTGLDPASRRATWNLVRSVRDRGAKVVLVTHLMEEAEALCDRVAIMNSGRVVAADRPATLTARHGGPVRMTFTTDGDVDGLRAIPGVLDVTVQGNQVEVRGDGCTPVRIAAELAAASNFPTDFRTHHPSLEDVFLELTGRRMIAAPGIEGRTSDSVGVDGAEAAVS